LGDARMGDRIAARRRKVVAVAAIAGTALAGASAAYGQGPFGQTDNPAAKQANVVFTNYRFRSGEILPQVRIHYATLGSPHLGASGQVDNAILVLHWTGSDSRALLTPTYMKALFDPGRPLDSARYYLIFADSIGCGRSSKPSDGLRTKFPHYTYGDMVDLQHKLVVEALHIPRLHAKRLDYQTDIAGGVASHYCFDPKTFDGLLFYTRRRVVRRTAETPDLSGPSTISLEFGSVVVSG
jgi:hypothetical protein